MFSLHPCLGQETFIIRIFKADSQNTPGLPKTTPGWTRVSIHFHFGIYNSRTTSIFASRPEPSRYRRTNLDGLALPRHHQGLVRDEATPEPLARSPPPIPTTLLCKPHNTRCQHWAGRDGGEGIRQSMRWMMVFSPVSASRRQEPTRFMRAGHVRAEAEMAKAAAAHMGCGEYGGRSGGWWREMQEGCSVGWAPGYDLACRRI